MDISEIDAQIQELKKKRLEVLKSEKKSAVAKVKELILTHKLKKGDLRGKALTQLLGEK